MNNPDINIDGGLEKIKGFAKDICEIHGAAEAYDIIEIVNAIEAAIPEDFHRFDDVESYFLSLKQARRKFDAARKAQELFHTITNQIKTKGG